MVGYSDAQAYGFAALFGLVQDLKLYAFKVVSGQPALDLSKYSLSASMANLGAVAGTFPETFLCSIFLPRSWVCAGFEVSLTERDRTISLVGHCTVLFLRQVPKHFRDLHRPALYPHYCVQRLLGHHGLEVGDNLLAHGSSSPCASRFFSGFSTITQPLAIIITAMWWKTREQPLRVGMFLAGSALGQLVGQGVSPVLHS